MAAKEDSNMSEFYFPLGIAKGEYFCNRVEETKTLVNNIQSGTHTVLISPRRYGKTSLAYRAIEKCGLPSIKIDLYMATGKDDVERAIIKGVNELIAQVTGVTEKLLHSIKSYIKTLKPTLEVVHDGFKLSLESTGQGTTTENICEALQILDQVLIKKKKKCVLLIDEFQEIERVAKNQGIEGAIRHVAQETENFSLIFSGSRCHLLKSMFNDKNKPLYRLCDEIILQRIDEKDYLAFINKFAKKKWNKQISKAVFTNLIEVTERHPYYFNAMLRALFLAKTQPGPKTIETTWQDLIGRKRDDLMAETKSLNITQKKILQAIADGINQELTGKEFLNKAKLASASTVRGLEQLLEEDLIEKLGKRYIMIDPLLKSLIKKGPVSFSSEAA